MAIIQNYMTKNPCYKANRSIAVKGLMLHSVGTPQPNPEVFIKLWNKETYNASCVHGVIGENDSYITLPILENHGTAFRGWHGGKGAKGSVNDTHIGIEMCEPSCIKYVSGPVYYGATITCSDYPAAQNFVEKVTRNAVELFAQLCNFHNLNPLEDGVIISHNEGGKRGIASAHIDPDHLWPQLKMDYNMDKFRQDVYKELQKIKGEEEVDLERFKELWYEMRLDLQDNDAGSWSKEARDWAVNTGLVQGTSDGEFNGAWEDLLTREQLVTVLYRFAKMMGKV